MDNNQYITINDKKYPVVFAHPERNWTWKKDDWLGDLSIINKTNFDLSQMIDEKNSKLHSLYESPSFKEYSLHEYSLELQSSWKLEGEDLDFLKIHANLAKQCERAAAPKEQNAVDAASLLLAASGDMACKQILAVHKRLLQGDAQAGVFRNSPKAVGRLANDAYEVVFEAPDPNAVPTWMEAYEQWWNDTRASALPQALGATLAHCYFAEIHPFHDGNGRMSRLMMNAFLKAQKPNHSLCLVPNCCISKAIVQRPSKYYTSLNEYSSKYEINSFVNYILNLQNDAIENAIRRVHLLEALNEIVAKYDSLLDADEMTILKNAVFSEGDILTLNELMADCTNEKTAIDACKMFIGSGIISLKGNITITEKTMESLAKSKGIPTKKKAKKRFL